MFPFTWTIHAWSASVSLNLITQHTLGFSGLLARVSTFLSSCTTIYNLHVSFLDLKTPTVPDWSDIQIKHAWNAVPMNWEGLGPLPTGTTINLRITLKPHHWHKDALTKVLPKLLYQTSSKLRGLRQKCVSLRSRRE